MLTSRRIIQCFFEHGMEGNAASAGSLPTPPLNALDLSIDRFLLTRAGWENRKGQGKLPLL